MAVTWAWAADEKTLASLEESSGSMSSNNIANEWQPKANTCAVGGEREGVNVTLHKQQFQLSAWMTQPQKNKWGLIDFLSNSTVLYSVHVYVALLFFNNVYTSMRMLLFNSLYKHW